MNEYSKWIMIGIIVAGILLGAGKLIRDIGYASIRITNIEEDRSEVNADNRLTKVETSFEYIVKQLDALLEK